MILSAFATQDVIFRIPSGSSLNNQVVVGTGGTTNNDNATIITNQTPCNPAVAHPAPLTNQRRQHGFLIQRPAL